VKKIIEERQQTHLVGGYWIFDRLAFTQGIEKLLKPALYISRHF
jgi:hypothetical protein